jgi:cold shock CspA family protein
MHLGGSVSRPRCGTCRRTGARVPRLLAAVAPDAQPGPVTRSGTSLGTVVRWDDDQGRGFIEAPDLPGECWVDVAAVHASTGGTRLRAGQIVEVEWEERAEGGLHVVRLRPRQDLQAAPGG